MRRHDPPSAARSPRLWAPVLTAALAALAYAAPGCSEGREPHDPLRIPWEQETEPNAEERAGSTAKGTTAARSPPVHTLESAPGRASPGVPPETPSKGDAAEAAAGSEVETAPLGVTPSLPVTVPEPGETPQPPSPGPGRAALAEASGGAPSRGEAPPAASSGAGAKASAEKGCLGEGCHAMEDHEVLHGPYAVSACRVCHTDHDVKEEARLPKLLVAPEPDLCVMCHTDIGDAIAEGPSGLPYVHGPAVAACTACHSPHGSPRKFVLKAEQPALCFNCHDALEDRIQAAAHKHSAIEAPFGCGGCHEPHASRFRFLLRDRTDALCFRCHNREIPLEGRRRPVADIARIVSESKFPHGPVATGDCQGCHDPHGSQYANLLKKAFPEAFYQPYDDSHYELCFQCHERALAHEEHTTTLTRFRNGDLNLHFLHVNREKGRSCRACHEIHASNHPFHIRDSVPYGRNNWPLPINFEPTPTGGSCAPGCHRKKTYVNRVPASESVTVPSAPPPQAPVPAAPRASTRVAAPGATESAPSPEPQGSPADSGAATSERRTR